MLFIIDLLILFCTKKVLLLAEANKRTKIRGTTFCLESCLSLDPTSVFTEIGAHAIGRAVRDCLLIDNQSSKAIVQRF